MDIGLSCSVWAAGERAGHLDGIGIYSRALWRGLSDVIGSSADTRLKPYAFGKNLAPMLCGNPKSLADDYKIHALMSGIFNLPLRQSQDVSRDVDLFHATDHLIPLIKGVPTVATIMDLIPVVHPEWIKQDLQRLKTWLFTTSIRRADHIITISEYSKQDLVKHLGVSPEKISVTPLGVDPVYFERVGSVERDAILQKYQLELGFFLFVGTLQPRKNLPRVIEAFKQLPSDIRKKRPLVIVGRNGWSNKELLPQLKELEESGEGRWLSYLPQTEVMALLQSAGALVFASLYEGFGLPVIEAFAAKCPVIASNNSSVPEVAGDAAWSIDPYQVDSISAAMLNVCQQEEVTNHKVQRGLVRAERYSWQACAEQTMDVYDKVLAGSR